MIELKNGNIEEPKLKARLLMQYVLNKSRQYVIVNDREELDNIKEKQYLEEIKILKKGVPIQHITHQKEFMKLSFFVDKNVLIPRQDTEILVEEVINIAKKNNAKKILDLCTGSGAIAVSLAKYLPQAEITAIDISNEALKIAKKNAISNNVENQITFISSDMFTNLNEEKFDIIVSNPPYIKTNVIKNLDIQVQNGRVHHRKGYQIPEAGRTARGTAIVNVLPLNPGESVTAMVITREFDENEFLMMVTRKGTVKRIPFVSLKTNRKAGIRAITLDEDDHLINVIRTNGDDDIVLATAFGYAICFNENDVRCMGRDAAGVRGIMLTDGDYVVGAEKAEEGKTLLTVTQNGYGKRTALTEYLRTGPNGEKQAQSRGGKGLKNYNITPKTGNVAGCRVVSESDDVMLIENGGVIIRIPASSINVYKRDVQGVIVMRIDDGNQVVSLERVEKMDEEETGEQA